MATPLTDQRKAVDTEKPFIEQYDSAVRKGDKARVERMEQVGPETYRDTLHKRGEYGAVMDDNQYSAMKEDEAFFNDELKKLSQNVIEISFKANEVKEQLMVIFTDIFGNDFTQTFKV